MLYRSFIANIASSVRNKFSDIFSSRANTTGDLGTATDGSKWTPINGTIQISGGTATATSTPATNAPGSSYPMAIQNMPNQNVTISLVNNSNQGSGVALWVQGSNDWWIVDATASQSSVTNYTSSDVFNYTATTTFTSADVAKYYSATTFWSTYLGTFSATSFSSATNYTAGIGTAFSASTSYSSAYAFTNYWSSTSTTFSQFLRIKQSVSGTVSQISSSTLSASQTIGSIRVITSGNSITARGFSDTNFVTQLGSDLVYTATGATITTKYGISISPSTYNQSAIIGTSVTIQ